MCESIWEMHLDERGGAGYLYLNLTLNSFVMNKVEGLLTVTDLIENNTLSSEMAALDWHCVEKRIPMLVGGGVGTGRTTTLNYLANFIKPDARVVSIEDYYKLSDDMPPEYRVDAMQRPKLSLYHKNWSPMRVPISWKGGYAEECGPSSSDLLREAIGQRPDYIIVDDLRGDEAYSLFRAMATNGCTSLATIHTPDVSETFKMLLSEEGMHIPRTLIPNPGVIKIQGLKRIEEFKLRAEEKLQQYKTEEERQQNWEQTMKELYPEPRIAEEPIRTLSTTEIIGLDQFTNEIFHNNLYSYNAEKDAYLFSGRSYLLEKLAIESGMSPKEVHEQVDMKKTVLEWMVESGIRNYPDVVDVIQKFYSNPEEVFNKAKETSLL